MGTIIARLKAWWYREVADSSRCLPCGLKQGECAAAGKGCRNCDNR